MAIYLLRKYSFLLISIFYFFSRLINLTLLPIFNDEAIYLSWGWKEVNSPSDTFLSLFDGKQPFLMWVFGGMQYLIADPLVAGRIVSVLTGGLTLLGIYFIAKHYFSHKTATIASILYIITPLFVFFDRQALMESAVGAVGVWSCYLILRAVEQRIFRFVVYSGILLGIGFFIKSSALLFFVSVIAIFSLVIIHGKKADKIQLGQYLAIILMLSQIVLLPLYFQPDFYLIFNLNDRFSLTIGELIRFPFGHWWMNIKALAEILFWHISPFVVVLATLGIIKNLRVQKENQSTLLLIIWFIVPILAVILTLRNPSARYIASFLPLITIFAAEGLGTIKNTPVKIFLVTGTVSMALFFTIHLLFNPLSYFHYMDRFTRFSQRYDYVLGWPSGYGIPKVRDYLRNEIRKNPNGIIIGMRADSGNPEDAIRTYFNQEKKAILLYFEKRMFSPKVFKNECFNSTIPFYFVSRENNLADMDKFLSLEKEFRKPDGKSYVGIYTFKKDCKGKSVTLNVE